MEIFCHFFNVFSSTPAVEPSLIEPVVNEKPIQAAWTLPGSEDWQMTGQIGGTTKALLRDGDILYLGDGLHVMVLDISKSDDIVVVGASPLLPQFIEFRG